jgi:hypothetical protein
MSLLDRYADLSPQPTTGTSAVMPAKRVDEVNSNFLKRIHEMKRLLCDIQDELEEICSKIEQIL